MSESGTPETVTRVREALSPYLGDEVATVDAGRDLAEAFGERYDSLTAMECVTAVEAAFGIEVDFVAHDVRHWFASVERIARFVDGELEDRVRLGSHG
ncbi:acyl carrier protein [Streptomyces radicis]|uniref:Acyl carrier protein n=1 Tax=Streptomyces radicis TaxID=1750517 RepID=A0A3A9VU33_9ACTN|nr:acyl carrier protein [Streptomyces radicis]RKN04515.1 acyl carrier protein [Streptomyces radicis]RKN15493.1 acyl carrier protein [Streptomyces radicis]